MSWIVMIACYAERTYVNEAWELMVEMQLQVAMRKKMNCQGIRKEAGCSWIEIESEIHEFVAGDRSHPRIVKIKSLLKGLDSSLTSFIQEEHKSIKVENFKLK
ncbi:hypothetical protein AMTR_s00070p00149440 [Amborella trichopoda]|uniref:Pentatricopeptide repeat-containing protein n=1 Tax=Amborella trichopoda TaxID=13333 RepID=U5DEK7_AMBTC|nr:hypothetical protein AMTR_s00070p00149440 [Amborella trichopoda]